MLYGCLFLVLLCMLDDLRISSWRIIKDIGYTVYVISCNSSCTMQRIET